MDVFWFFKPKQWMIGVEIETTEYTSVYICLPMILIIIDLGEWMGRW